MNPAVEQFFGDLHRDHLKPIGYKKTRHTFSKEKGDHVVRFNFRGSSWNDSDGAWRFYINVGVGFPTLEFRDIGFPGVHCCARIGQILPTAPQDFALPVTEVQPFAKMIADVLEDAHTRIIENLPRIRSYYDKSCSAQLKIA